MWCSMVHTFNQSSQDAEESVSSSQAYIARSWGGGGGKAEGERLKNVLGGCGDTWFIPG